MAKHELRSWSAYALGPVVGLITAPIISRALGPEGRGTVAAILQPLTVADAFAAVGLPTAVAYFVARGTDAKSTLRRSRALACVPAALTFAVLALYGRTLATEYGLSYWSFLLPWLSIFVGVEFSLRRGVLQGATKFARLDAERALSAALRLLLIVLVVVFLPAGPVLIVCASLAATILPGLLMLSLLKGVGVAERESQPAHVRSIAKYSAVIAVGTIAVTLNNRLDQAILPTIFSAEALGYYAVAVTVAEIPLIATTIAARNLLPQVARAGLGKPARRSLIVGATATAAASGVVALIAPWMLPLAFGDDFAPAVPAVQVLAVATVAGGIALMLTAVLTGFGRPVLASLSQGCGIVVTLAVYLPFGDSLDVVGAALVSVASQVTVLAVAAGCTGWLVCRPPKRTT